MPTVNITKSAGYGRRGPADAGGGTVYAPEWAALSGKAGGNPYGVIGDAWRITPGAADREIVISPGRGFGWGVIDTSEQARMQLPAPSSGTVRHLIVVRRDWQSRQSSFRNIIGQATPVLPARETTYGVVDDQPIGLVSVTAGQAQIGEYIDLRVWSGPGGSYASNGHVLQYLTDIGTSLLIGETRAERIIDALGNPAWRFTDESDKFERVAELGAGFEHYFGSGWNGLTVARRGQIVTGGGALIKDPNGVGLTVPKGTPIARLPFDYVPKEKVATTSPEIEINTEGQLVLTVDAPVGKAISCSFTFHRRNVIGL